MAIPTNNQQLGGGGGLVGQPLLVNQNQLGQVGPAIVGQQPVQPGAFNPPGFNPNGVQLPPTGLIGSEQALRGGISGALSGLQRGVGQGRSDVLTQTGLGTAPLNQFVSPGQQAQQRQGALSGAFGNAAQAQAFQNFLDSPEQAFLRERGDLAVTRNASALGGLGGGRVQQELQRQGIGLAAQDFQNQFNRLGDVTGQGLQAAGLSGQLRGNAASALGNIGLQSGQTAGSFAQRSGQDLAAGRSQAGRDLASAVGGTASALSNLVNQQGQGASDLVGQGGSNLAGLLEPAGQSQGLNQEQLAALLSGQQLTGSGQIAGLPSLGGTQQTAGNIGDIASLIGAAGTAYTAFGG